MRKLRVFWLILATGVLSALPAVGAPSTNLVFDAITKEYTAKVGELNTEFSFAVTNRAATDITIHSVRASCGCTTPRLPSLPWKLLPGESGTIPVGVDLRGKFGTFQKSISLDTTDGPKMLFVKVTIPSNSTGGNIVVPGDDARTRNMQLAHADRQIVFRGECADCHAKPGFGKKGEQLFTAVCGICHEAEHRASAVPDLHALKQAPSVPYWDAWIRNGKVGTMMPGFAKDHGGPLTDDQIGSLVEYLMNDFSKRKRVLAAKPAPPKPAQNEPVTAPIIKVQPPSAPTVDSIVGLPPLPGENAAPKPGN